MDKDTIDLICELGNQIDESENRLIELAKQLKDERECLNASWKTLNQIVNGEPLSIVDPNNGNKISVEYVTKRVYAPELKRQTTHKMPIVKINKRN